MNTRDNMSDNTSVGTGDLAMNESSDNDLSSLLNYPSIGRLFDGPDPNALENMRSRLSTTSRELERIIRQGSKEEAEKAGRVIKAINVTLDFLNALDRMKHGQEAKT